MNETTLYPHFLKLAGGIVTITCLTKLVSVFGTAEALKLPDALFGLQHRWVMLLAAGVEAGVLVVLRSRAAPLPKLASILWLSLNFATYRFCLWLMGVGAPCPCMGNSYGWIGMDAATMDRVMGGLVVLLVSGSAYLLVKIRDTAGCETCAITGQARGEVSGRPALFVCSIVSVRAGAGFLRRGRTVRRGE